MAGNPGKRRNAFSVCLPMERATPSPNLLVADDSLHNFDKTTDLREFLLVPIRFHAMPMRQNGSFQPRSGF
jgi:hypothetical protein